MADIGAGHVPRTQVVLGGHSTPGPKQLGLHTPEPSVFGEVTGRAEAQVVRLAALQAVANLSKTIELEHFEAAVALWEYSEESTRYIFVDNTGDPAADKILRALRSNPERSLVRTEINKELFKGNSSSARIDDALRLLERAGCVRRIEQKTGGRPAERWCLRYTK